MSTILTFGLGKEHGGNNYISCNANISLNDTDLDLFISDTGTITLENGIQKVDVFFDESLTMPDVNNTNITIN